MSDNNDSKHPEKTQVCKCGNDTYHIKFRFNGDVWAVCAECDRRTSTIGVPISRLTKDPDGEEGSPSA